MSGDEFTLYDLRVEVVLRPGGTAGRAVPGWPARASCSRPGASFSFYALSALPRAGLISDS